MIVDVDAEIKSRAAQLPPQLDNFERKINVRVST